MPEFTTQQVADLLGVSPQRVRQLSQERNIGRKFGRDLAFTQSDIDALKSRRPVGRPKKSI